MTERLHSKAIARSVWHEMNPAPAAEMVQAELFASNMQRSSGSGLIAVCRRGPGTVLRRSREEGCARVRYPRRQDVSMEAVLINTSGGMTGGDRLDWRIEVGEGAHVAVTTQAAEKIYRADFGDATVTTRISLEKGARLAWLPQETILFDRSSLTRRFCCGIGAGARLLVCEPVLFGRLGHGEQMARGNFADSWQIEREGALLHAERFRLGGAIDGILAANPTFGGHAAMATLLLVGDDSEALCSHARELLDGFVNVVSGVSHWHTGKAGGKLLARMLARDGYELRQALVPLLTLLNGGAELPKSWAL
jgi:urease accessory protein